MWSNRYSTSGVFPGQATISRWANIHSVQGNFTGQVALFLSRGRILQEFILALQRWLGIRRMEE